MPTPDDVYAEFGKAAEHAQHFESALGTVLLVHKIFENEATPSSDLDETDYPDLLGRIDRNTLGALIRKVDGKVTVPENLKTVFASALRARNYLIHAFYREHVLSIETEIGSDAMVTRLSELGGQLAEAQSHAERLLRSYIENQPASCNDAREA